MGKIHRHHIIIYINTVRLFFSALWSTLLPNEYFRNILFRKLMIRQWWQFPLLLLIPSQKKFNKKSNVNLDSAASNGGQGNLTYFVYCSWPPFEAALSRFTFPPTSQPYLNVVCNFYFSYWHFVSDPLISERNCPVSSIDKHNFWCLLSLILRRSRTGTVWFYTSTSNKRAAPPKLYTKSLTGDLKLMYSRLTLMRISINL